MGGSLVVVNLVVVVSIIRMAIVVMVMVLIFLLQRKVGMVSDNGHGTAKSSGYLFSLVYFLIVCFCETIELHPCIVF